MGGSRGFIPTNQLSIEYFCITMSRTIQRRSSRATETRIISIRITIIAIVGLALALIKRVLKMSVPRVNQAVTLLEAAIGESGRKFTEMRYKYDNATYR